MADPDEESIVISGISCRLPQCENMQEFRDNLMNGVDMVVPDNSRYKPGEYGIPARTGHLKSDLTRFDATYFGVHPKQANRLDPQIRMLLEVTYEALIDAGRDPSELRGSKTGVFVTANTLESFESWRMKGDSLQGYMLVGCLGNMPANRISFHFDFTGPSYAIDTACSSSLSALNEAVRNIRCGLCDAAIVAGTELLLKETSYVPYVQMTLLSADGKCKSFDKDGNGFVRSEGVVSIYLQKRKSAKRIYCTVLNSRVNNDGFKEEGITGPSAAMQQQLLREVYDEVSVDPKDVSYLEAHGTGTKVGDPIELNTACEFFCKNRKNPLKIGSVKSNIGHAELSSGLVSVAKLIITMEEQTIPGNLHYNNPNPDIPGLVDGRLKVVSQKTKLDPGYVAVSSFGIGGSNCHILLKPESHRKMGDSVNTKKKRLLLYSSRTAEGVESTLKQFYLNPPDLHTHLMINTTAHQSPIGHPYRGFVVLNGSGECHVKKASTEQRPIWYVFPGMGTQWRGMGKNMMEIDAFKTSIMNSDRVLKSYGIKLYEMIMNSNATTYEHITNSFVAIAAIQIALVDILAEIGITPQGIIGHSVGELGCAYADGCFTAEETILAAYWRGQAIESSDLPRGGMAAVGLTWKQAHAECPDGVTPACHNAEDNVTVSGEEKQVERFVLALKSRNVFAKAVKSSGIAFHSRDMLAVAPFLLDALKQVIESPKPRTSRWKSSSIPEKDWHSDLAKFSSAEYHVNNLVSPVLFQEVLKKIPDNAVVIEVGPHSLLQSILKRALPSSSYIAGLMMRGSEDNVEHCFSSLGYCYQYGLKFNPLKLEPMHNFPVPPGTKMISPFVRWNHTEKWDVPSLEDENWKNSCHFDIDTSFGSEYHFLLDHRISGNPLFPASGFIYLVWKTLAVLLRQPFEELGVELFDIKFLLPVIMPANDKFHLDVNVIRSTGNFVVNQSQTAIVTGRYTTFKEEKKVTESKAEMGDVKNVKLDLLTQDIYIAMALDESGFGPAFQGIIGLNKSLDTGLLRWKGNWILYIDLLLQMMVFPRKEGKRVVPTRIRSIIIDPVKHLQRMEEEVPAYYDACNGIGYSGGIRISGVHTGRFSGDVGKDPVLENYIFIPYVNTDPEELANDLNGYIQECSRYLPNNKLEIRTRALSKKYPCLLLNDPVIKSSIQEYGSYLEFLKNQSNLRYSSEDTIIQNALVQDRMNCIQTDVLLNVLVRSQYLKVCLDVVLENVNKHTIEIMEVGDRGMTNFIQKLLNGYWNCRASFMIATDTVSPEKESDVKMIKMSPMEGTANFENKVQVILLNNILHEQENISTSLENVKNHVQDGGFLLVQEWTQNFHLIEPLDNSIPERVSLTDAEQRSFGIYCSADTWKKIFTSHGLEVIFQRTEENLSSLFLLKKTACYHSVVNRNVLDITDPNYSWLNKVKEGMADAFQKSLQNEIWLTTSEVSSGILGMVNCLRKEPGGSNLRCIFDQDNVKNSDKKSDAFRKGLVMNVYREDCHGSYRHIPLKETDVLSKYAYVNQEIEGSLASLKWTESDLKMRMSDQNTSISNQTKMCFVHYASLNFRDVMLATGRLPSDAIPKVAAKSKCLLGLECSGRDVEGKPIMCMPVGKGIGTVVEVPHHCMWQVPSHWTLEEAATVPVVYTTAYYALVVRGNIQNSERVLIHSGSGGVGQAAISIALSYNCEVFTTVGTQEKKEFLLQRFPQLSADHFFSSRDTMFEQGVLKSTHGKGVDIVLNSLSEEKLHASVRVLAMNGRFLEIGKYDLSKNTELGMSIFLKNISFHGIVLDAICKEDNDGWRKTSAYFIDGIKNGVVTPLTTTIFGKNRVEDAFRYMARGKHIGKILIKIQSNEEATLPETISVLPKTYFHPDKSYIIVGGLGGFGLQLSEWLVERGARNLILTSRSGVKTGYQRGKLQEFRNQGVDVRISQKDVGIREEAHDLLVDTNGYHVGGIFNLAVVLEDALFENQTQESFLKVSKPKLSGTTYLDIYSRELCKETCDWFVVFSSVSSGFGNKGQSNYGLANSAMERICERRRHDGLPGLAIQWGPIGDVGVYIATVGNNDSAINGMLPQRISSCISVLDKLFNQNEAVVASYVQEDIKINHQKNDEINLFSEVCNILGVKDPSTIDLNLTLGDYGADSLMSVEVELLLQNKYNIRRTLAEVRKLPFGSLNALVKGELPMPENSEEQSEYSPIPVDMIKKLNDVDSELPPLYLIHTLIATTEFYEPIAKLIEVPVYGVQCTADVPKSSIEDMATFYLKAIKSHNGSSKFHLGGYSMGVSVAYEMTRQAEGHGTVDTQTAEYGDILGLILFDGVPSVKQAFPEMTKMSFDDYKIQVEREKDGRSVRYSLREYITAIIGSNQSIISNVALAYHKRLHKCCITYDPIGGLDREVDLIYAKENMVFDDFPNLDALISRGKMNKFEVPGNHLTLMRFGNEVYPAAIVNQILKKY